MAPSTKATLKIRIVMVLESKPAVLDHATLANGKIIKPTVKVNSSMLMVTSTKVNG